MRLRTIKKYGNTFVVTLTTADVKDFNLKIGQEVDIEEMMKKGKVKKK